MGFKVKLDTNGYHPERLKELYREGLIDYVAMDIKNSLEKYGITSKSSPKGILYLIKILPRHQMRTW